MSKWKKLSFDDVIVDETKSAIKIKKEDYLVSGKYQIVDQGQAQIAGYTNNEDGLYTKVPAIIFGDHTRIIKYIDKPLFLGADGVKLLKIKSNYLDYKFLFYYFVKNEVPNTGYNRHFKWLKELSIPLPPLDVQRYIADTLDKTQEIIDGHKKQLEELDNLIKATFYDMFGDPICNSHNWGKNKLGELGIMASGGTPSRINREYFNGKIDWYTAGELNNLYLEESIEKITEKAIKESSTKLFSKGSLLIGMYDTAAFKMGILTKDSCANQACANICLNKNRGAHVIWLYFNLLLMKEYFLSNRRGIRQKNLNLGMIKDFEIPLPSIDLQNKFAEIVTNIEEQKGLVKQSVTEAQNLFNSLMSEYFD